MLVIEKMIMVTICNKVNRKFVVVVAEYTKYDGIISKQKDVFLLVGFFKWSSIRKYVSANATNYLLYVEQVNLKPDLPLISLFLSNL